MMVEVNVQATRGADDDEKNVEGAAARAEADELRVGVGSICAHRAARPG